MTFGWSGDGRLTGYTIAGGATVGLFYDAAGRLVRRDVNGSPASYFLWEGENLLAELDGGQYLVAQYSYYPGLDRLHAFNRSGSVSYAQADAEGNVRHLGTNVYNQVRSYVYDESGNLVGGYDVGGLNGTDRARWKGALYLAPEAGLYYMRARWYEPRTGRFLSEDPSGLAGGLNPYIFAGSDPINGFDPTGLQDPLCPFRDRSKCRLAPWEIQGKQDGEEATAEVVEVDRWWGLTAERLCGYNPSPNCVPWEYPSLQQARGPLAKACANGFNTEQCRRLVRALVALTTSARGQCRALGTTANERFLSGWFVFDPSLAGSAYGRTLPRSRSENLRRVTWLGPDAFRPLQTANTIAHEEWHHQNPRGNPLGAYAAGNSCAF